MAKLVKMNGDSEPQIIDITIDEKNNVYLNAKINVNVVKLTDGTYEWDSLIIPDFAVNNIHNADDNLKYGIIVAHIIKAYYSDNNMTAILNNYLLDNTDPKYIKEFEQMQKVRKLAKETAKTIIENNLF